MVNYIPQSDNFQTLILDSECGSLKPMSARTLDFQWALQQTVSCFSPEGCPQSQGSVRRESGPHSCLPIFCKELHGKGKSHPPKARNHHKHSRDEWVVRSRSGILALSSILPIRDKPLGFLLLCMASSPDVLTRRDGGDNYETAMKYILSSWNFSYCHYIYLLRGSWELCKIAQ